MIIRHLLLATAILPAANAIASSCEPAPPPPPANVVAVCTTPGDGRAYTYGGPESSLPDYCRPTGWSVTSSTGPVLP